MVKFCRAGSSGPGSEISSMHCLHCHKELAGQVLYCPHCGTHSTPRTTVAASVAPNMVAQHQGTASRSVGILLHLVSPTSRPSCSSCQRELTTRARFCSHCGSPTAKPASDRQPRVAEVVAAAPERS